MCVCVCLSVHVYVCVFDNHSLTVRPIDAFFACILIWYQDASYFFTLRISKGYLRSKKSKEGQFEQKFQMLSGIQMFVYILLLYPQPICDMISWPCKSLQVTWGHRRSIGVQIWKMHRVTQFLVFTLILYPWPISFLSFWPHQWSLDGKRR